jgi:hypothetical protein
LLVLSRILADFIAPSWTLCQLLLDFIRSRQSRAGGGLRLFFCVCGLQVSELLLLLLLLLLLVLAEPEESQLDLLLETATLVLLLLALFTLLLLLWVVDGCVDPICVGVTVGRAVRGPRERLVRAAISCVKGDDRYRLWESGGGATRIACPAVVGRRLATVGAE